MNKQTLFICGLLLLVGGIICLGIGNIIMTLKGGEGIQYVEIGTIEMLIGGALFASGFVRKENN